MKILNITFILLCILFASCSGSDSYRGAWKAIDNQGKELQIIFEEKAFIVRDSSKLKHNFTYTQNGVSYINGIVTYAIKLNDGREYKINFPLLERKDVALIKDHSNNILYSMGRNEYVKYNDLMKLN